MSGRGWEALLECRLGRKSYPEGRESSGGPTREPGGDATPYQKAREESGESEGPPGGLDGSVSPEGWEGC